MKTKPHLRLLLVEDSETDMLLLKEAFSDLDGFRHELVHVERLTNALTLLQDEHFDVVLLDLGLPDSQGVETFVTLHQHKPDIPVLVLTSLNDESVAVKAMKLGAQDYLPKNQIHPALLARSVRYAIERQQSTSELLQSQKQLRSLAARLQEVREAERKHIAREIHDELGQMLTALKMDLSWVKKKLAQTFDPESIKAIKAKNGEAEKLIDRTIEAVQRIALELRPSALDSLGLTEAIRDEGRRFEHRSGVKLSMTLPEKLPPLKPETVTAFFRIFQELMTNVLRHANAQTVALQLGEDRGCLELTVQDDGKGMASDALTRRTSLGLLGMSERALSLGGTIQFEGAHQRGTRATLRIPIKIS